ncbi:hypothetical protein KVP09_16170 [Alcaligenaceae bacterium CGII-47]|nr:hypothetical protein [Alcaligenaceae bacterium CGII-47]
MKHGVKTFGLAGLVGLMGLAGCAGQPGVVPLSTLESPTYLVAQRRLPMDFPAIQQALFKHQAACNETFTFQGNPNSFSYAQVTYRPTPDAGWDRTILINLVFYQNRSTRASAYSYYSGQGEMVDRIFAAILHPEVCEGASSYPEITDSLLM